MTFQGGRTSSLNGQPAQPFHSFGPKTVLSSPFPFFLLGRILALDWFICCFEPPFTSLRTHYMQCWRPLPSCCPHDFLARPTRFVTVPFEVFRFRSRKGYFFSFACARKVIAPRVPFMFPTRPSAPDPITNFFFPPLERLLAGSIPHRGSLSYPVFPS